MIDASTFFAFAMIVIIVAAIYMTPLIVAHFRGHRNENAIGVINLLLGWTLVGWAVSMAWALTENID